MEVVTALPHMLLGEVLIFVWNVEKRKTQWKAKDLAALQHVGEKKKHGSYQSMPLSVKPKTKERKICCWIQLLLFAEPNYILSLV